MLTRPGARWDASRYSAGLISPSRCPATWSASATMPENRGEDSLVPQTAYQPAGSPPKVWYTLTVAEQAALIEMSGTPRWLPVMPRTLPWYEGRANTTDLPPPVLSGFGPLLPSASWFAFWS